MAKFKKTANKTAGRKAEAPSSGERLNRSISESAQQIWLAGMGAFARAQAEGTKLFEALVKEGLGLEQTARRFAGGQAGAVRDAVESRVGQARERAADTWDRLEKVFEDRVQRALVKLGVPNREDLQALSARVDALTAELRRQERNEGARQARSSAARKPAPARKTAAKKSAGPRTRRARDAAPHA